MDLNLHKRIFAKRYSLHELSFPVLALIAASVLLFVILGVMTFQNFNREKKLLKDHLFRQGLTLIRALEVGARTGMMEMMWYILNSSFTSPKGGTGQGLAIGNPIASMQAVDNAVLGDVAKGI